MGIDYDDGRARPNCRALPSARPDPFCTYADFAREHGFSEKCPPAWANGATLNAAADALKHHPVIGLDLTFLIRSATTDYPSVIDAKPYDGTPQHKQRAREVADKIIAVQAEGEESLLA